MNNRLEGINDLADLESFDPAVFIADEVVSQNVCNFVLTLSLVFNDFKDLVYGHITLEKYKPQGSFVISRHWGSYGGLKGHLFRMMIALFFEFMKLLNENTKVLNDPFFQSVLQHLTQNERKTWSSLVCAAQDQYTDTPIGNFALRVRNKMAFHYDLKEIQSGYQNFFASGSYGTERAFISRGDNMAETRYYFADAAARGYLMKNFKGKDADKLLEDTVFHLHYLTPVLMQIIHFFVQKRGYAYRLENEDN